MLRPRVETALAITLAVVAATTLVWPRWLEIQTGFAPDAGSGAAEWGIVAACAALALAAALLAGRDYRLAAARVRGAAGGAAA